MTRQFDLWIPKLKSPHISEPFVTEMESKPDIQQNVTESSLAPERFRQFNYRPLHHAEGEDIRLLILYPGDFGDPIRCDVFHASLSFEVDYEAVSYTWATEDGDASLSQQISCAYVGEADDSDLPVTVNCASALRRLRDKSYERTLWIDAICIKVCGPRTSSGVNTKTSIVSSTSCLTSL